MIDAEDRFVQPVDDSELKQGRTDGSEKDNPRLPAGDREAHDSDISVPAGPRPA